MSHKQGSTTIIDLLSGPNNSAQKQIDLASNGPNNVGRRFPPDGKANFRHVPSNDLLDVLKTGRFKTLQHLNSTEWGSGQLLQGRRGPLQPREEEPRGRERRREARRRFRQHCRRQSRRRQGFSCQVQTNFTFLIRGRVGINTPLSTKHLINTPPTF